MSARIEYIRLKVSEAEEELRKLRQWLALCQRTNTNTYLIDHYEAFSHIVSLRKAKRLKIKSKEIVDYQANKITDVLASLTNIHGHSALHDELKEMNYSLSNI